MASRLPIAAAVACLPWCATATAADLVQPWAPGLSELEVFVTHENGQDEPQWSALVGGMLVPGLSVGVAFQYADGRTSRLGAVAIWTTEFSSRTSVDVWGEVGLDRTPVEAELGAVSFAAGAEWSRDLGGAIPYSRASYTVDDDVGSAHTLLGLKIPIGSLVELHIEASSREPEFGPWPLHLAVGPNIVLSPTLKLLPEVSWIHDRAASESTWVLTFGVCMDPRQILAR
ncbi:MAG: hypothetical protein ACOY3Y_10260 [Acidobacteriota bacterium]